MDTYRRSLTTIVLLFAFALVPWLGVSDFYSRGEPREALVAQSMVTNHNWILPKAHNDSVPSKPPLFHWIAASASLPFDGVNEFTSRLPSALFSIGALLLSLVLLREHLPGAEAWIFATLLCFSFEWIRASVSARVDMVHAGALATGLLAAYRAISTTSIGWSMGGTLLLALATLGKGPVGLVIPTLTLFPWVWFTGVHRRREITRVALMVGGAALLSSTWYIAAYLQSPQEFMYRFWDENVGRFTGTMEDQPHKHSAFFLLGMLLLGTAPWSLIALWSCFRARRELPTLSLRKWRDYPRINQFSLLASAVIILFYCIPSSKRGVYLLAAYPFLAFLGTVFMRRLHWSIRSWKVSFLTACGLVILAQGVVIPLLVAPAESERPLAAALTSLARTEGQFYCYGFAFYGTSFYLNRPFLRLESVNQEHKRVPQAGDTVLTFSAPGDLEPILAPYGRTPHPIAELALGNKKVHVIEVQ